MTPGKFHHYGVPTQQKHQDETFIEGAGVWVTDPEAHPYRVEFLRFESDTCMPSDLREQAHAAFEVESLEKAMAGKEVVVEPFDATDELRVAFIKDGDALIEIMQPK